MTISEEHYAVFSLIVYIIYGLFAWLGIRMQNLDFNKLEKRITEGKSINNYIDKNIGKGHCILGLVTGFFSGIFWSTNHPGSLFVITFAVPILSGFFIPYCYCKSLKTKKGERSRTVYERGLFLPEFKKKYLRIRLFTVLFCFYCANIIIATAGDVTFSKGQVDADVVITKTWEARRNKHGFEIEPTNKRPTFIPTEHGDSKINQFLLKESTITSLLFLMKEDEQDWSEEISEKGINVSDTDYYTYHVGDTIRCTFTISYLGNFLDKLNRLESTKNSD